MAKKNKTTATRADPVGFIDKVKDEVKRRDSHELAALMQDGPSGLAAEAANPSFLAVDAKRQVLFVVNETSNFGGRPSGAVSAYAIEAGTGRQRGEDAVAVSPRLRGVGDRRLEIRHDNGTAKFCSSMRYNCF